MKPILLSFWGIVTLSIAITSCGKKASHKFYGQSEESKENESDSRARTHPDLEEEGIFESTIQNPDPHDHKAAVHPDDTLVRYDDDIIYDKIPTSLSLTDREIAKLRLASSISYNQQKEFREARIWQVKILELRYFPVNKKGNFDTQETDSPSDWTLPMVRERANQINQQALLGLEKSSQGADNTSDPYLHYTIVASKEFRKAINVRVETPHGAHFPDHNIMLNSDVDICDWVDNKGIREVWVWMYHRGIDVVPIESNMSMGQVSRQYFNYGSFGDVSNSWREDDLPHCQNTYMVYEFNINRGAAEVLHNYGHTREAMYSFLDPSIWQKNFIEPFGSDDSNQRKINHCGNVHFPPNAAYGYDYKNERDILTNCSNWLKDAGDPIKYDIVSCASWGCDHYDWLVWWGQRIPGIGNQLKFGMRELRNFYEFFADFDIAMAIGKTLYKLEPGVLPSPSNLVACPASYQSRCNILVTEVAKNSASCGLKMTSKDSSFDSYQKLPNDLPLDVCIAQQIETIINYQEFFQDDLFFIEYDSAAIIEFF